jgi:hypothetical protein
MKVLDPLGVPKKIKDVAEHNPVTNKLTHGRRNAFERFPLLFTLLAAFGVIATTDGFQRLMSKIPLLANNPYITLIIGIITLLITGTLYKKL